MPDYQLMEAYIHMCMFHGSKCLHLHISWKLVFVFAYFIEAMFTCSCFMQASVYNCMFRGSNC